MKLWAVKTSVSLVQISKAMGKICTRGDISNKVKILMTLMLTAMLRDIEDGCKRSTMAEMSTVMVKTTTITKSTSTVVKMATDVKTTPTVEVEIYNYRKLLVIWV